MTRKYVVKLFVLIPKEISQRLVKAGISTGLTKSELVRQALLVYLKATA